MIQITPIKDNQLLELVALAQETFVDAYGAKTDAKDMETYCNSAFNLEKIDKDYQNTDVAYFFVQCKQQNIGYIKLRWDRTPSDLADTKALEVERFYLQKAFYGKGIGLKMLAFCENLAKDQSFEWIWLLVWPENTIGLRFYQKHGFQRFATKIFDFAGHLSEDWLLKKKIIY